MAATASLTPPAPTQQAGRDGQQYGAAGYSHAGKTDYLLEGIFHAYYYISKEPELSSVFPAATKIFRFAWPDGSDLPVTCSRGLGRGGLPIYREGHGKRFAPFNFGHDPAMLFLHLGYEFLSSGQHPPDPAPKRTGGGIRFGE